MSILEGGYGRDCEDDSDGVAREPGAGLAAAIDDQRLRSFDACLEAHLDAIRAENSIGVLCRAGVGQLKPWPRGQACSQMVFHQKKCVDYQWVRLHVWDPGIAKP